MAIYLRKTQGRWDEVSYTIPGDYVAMTGEEYYELREQIEELERKKKEVVFQKELNSNNKITYCDYIKHKFW